MTTQPEQWEEKLELIVLASNWLTEKETQTVKSFISSLLASQKAELRKNVEGINEQVRCAKCDGSKQVVRTQRCEALSEVLKLLK